MLLSKQKKVKGRLKYFQTAFAILQKYKTISE